MPLLETSREDDHERKLPWVTFREDSWVVLGFFSTVLLLTAPLNSGGPCLQLTPDLQRREDLHTDPQHRQNILDGKSLNRACSTAQRRERSMHAGPGALRQDAARGRYPPHRRRSASGPFVCGSPHPARKAKTRSPEHCKVVDLSRNFQNHVVSLKPQHIRAFPVGASTSCGELWAQPPKP